MKNSHEHKSNIVHRLINSTWKFAKGHIVHQSNSSIDKFKYELPESFLKAVDRARLAAGYDILPRHRHRSISPSIQRTPSCSSSSSSSSSPVRLNDRDQSKGKVSYSSSADDINRVVTRKVPFRRIPRTQVHHQRHQPTSTAIFIPSRSRFPRMSNTNLMNMHRFPRPRNNMFSFPIRHRLTLFPFRF